MRKLIGAVALLVWVGLASAQDFKLEDGFTLLFNGKDLTGWKIMNDGKFEAKDGIIFLNKGSGWLRSEKQFKDFELRMDFRFMNKGADGGIFLRAGEDGKNWPAKAYQVQTMDNNSLGGIFASGLAGAKVKRDAEAQKKSQKPAMEWQSYVITVQGPKLEVKLNGETITTAEGLADMAGFIGIQGEGGLHEYKNIRVKELK